MEDKDKFFNALIKNYFDHDVMPKYFFNMNALLEKLEDEKFKEDFEKKIGEIGKIEYSKIKCNQETFIQNKDGKERVFKFVNFFLYYYGCKRLRDDFFEALKKFFKDKTSFGVETDLIKFAEDKIYKQFKKKYKDKDIYIVSNYEYILECDIANFYPSIYTHNFPRIINNSRDNIKQKSLDTFKELGHFLDVFVRTSQGGESVGIPIGSSLFCVLVEIISVQIDSEVKEKLDNKGIKFECCRVVDDRLFGFKSQKDAEMGKKIFIEILNKYHLQINESKTSIRKSDESFQASWIYDLERLANLKEKDVKKANDIIFHIYNTFATPKEKSGFLKYVIKIVRKYEYNDKSFDLLLRIITAEPLNINLLAPYIKKNINKFKDTHKEILINKMIELIKEKNHETGLVVFCLYILTFFPLGSVKDKINQINIPENSICYIIWNKLYDEKRELNNSHIFCLINSKKNDEENQAYQECYEFLANHKIFQHLLT